MYAINIPCAYSFFDYDDYEKQEETDSNIPS